MKEYLKNAGKHLFWLILGTVGIPIGIGFFLILAVVGVLAITGFMIGAGLTFLVITAAGMVTGKDHVGEIEVTVERCRKS